MTTLHFACGATYQLTAEPLRDKDGVLQRLIVYAQGSEIKSPALSDGREAECLHLCPAKTGFSRRKVQMAWVGEKAIKPAGDPVRCVLCKPWRAST